jgi:hypothetical protein
MINESSHCSPPFHHSRFERSEPEFLLSVPGKIGQMEDITKIGSLFTLYVDIWF